MVRSPWISDLHWVRTGRQSRSRKTQESLLDAAEEIFFQKGADATSVADVAARAGCSVGAVYHHFRDKRALLLDLLDWGFYDCCSLRFFSGTLLSLALAFFTLFLSSALGCRDVNLLAHFHGRTCLVDFGKPLPDSRFESGRQCTHVVLDRIG